MEVFVRGARSSSVDWARSRSAPLSELPSLDDDQKAQARRGNVSEEEFARIAYAEHLTVQKLLRRLLKFGQWLNGKVEERSPDAHIERMELDTLKGRIEVLGTAGGEEFDFELDEDLVDRFLTAGSAEAEASIFRVVDVFLPRGTVARAS